MKRTIAALIVAAAAGLGAEAGALDDFYQARLQEGRVAFQTGRPAEAVDQLRVACFGLMDNPPLYSEAIVWLGLAQERLGRVAEVDATLRRFLEAEKRFGGYARIVLPAESRREFDALLSRRLPPGVLLAAPSLSRLVETEEQRIAKLPASERARALKAKAKADLFVSLAAAKRWDEARDAAKGLAAVQLARPDVAAALATLPPAP